MLLHNTLTKKKEEFIPINPGKVSIYTCGPTVYDYVHIGNLRSYTFADILVRQMTHSGYEVRFIKNITDVGHLTDDDVAQGDSGEDKMLKKARLEKKDPYEIARFYENAAKEAESEMNITPAHYHPRATEHIPQMIAMIEDLITKGHAYEANGNVFFAVESFTNYGTLSGNTLENLDVGARLSDPHPDKRSQWDFALWLSAPDNHLMKWESPWSTGYPGWHIECSAMSAEYLGDTFDIHTGGEDNIFPHHEAEIAQSQCATGSSFVKYWMHSRFLLVDGKKMSKSKGNFYTLESIKNKGFSAMDLRMLYLLSHYRSQMNFTWESLEQAKSNRQTLERFYKRLAEYKPSSEEVVDLDIVQALRAFDSAMNDDLNTPAALTILLQFITTGNAAMDSAKSFDQTAAIRLITETAGNVFGLTLTQPTTDIPSEIVSLAEQRKQAKTDKDFQKADELRDEITAKGYAIEDTSDGYTITTI